MRWPPWSLLQVLKEGKLFPLHQVVLVLSPPPQLPRVDPAVLEMHQSIRAAHANIMKMAEKAGIEDLCTSERETSVEDALKNISGENLKCRICKKTKSTTQHLRNHIRTKHLKKTPYRCSTCLKYYGGHFCP